MPAAVERQVIRAGEAAVTVCTLEWLHSRVLAVMPRQFVGSSKLPGAAFPGTFVGLFSWEKQKKEGRGKTGCDFPLVAINPHNPLCTLPMNMHCLGVALGQITQL